MKKPKLGFTLIELLIVVAIIGILAAIAVPNFLNAQVRAKVAKAVSNMRSVSTALESYRLDNNTYPRWAWDPHYYGFWQLTSPIPYISSSSFENPFRGKAQWRGHSVGGKEIDPYFEMATFSAKGDSYSKNWPRNVWLLESAGPDVEDDYNANNFPQKGIAYQPSNGIKSNGDIYRAGGAQIPQWCATLTY
jgi:prepilin-type N-terminal cleavage/methylation domain-containing protein